MKKNFKHKRNFSSQNVKPKTSLEKIDIETQKKYIKNIEELYQATFKVLPKQLYINSKQKIYVSTINEIPKHLTRINAIGLYLGTLVDSGHIRLSIEGTQLLNRAQTNFVVLDDNSLASYLAGENLFFEEIKEEYLDDTHNTPFVIIYDILGNALGTISKKEKYYLNYLSKGRKMNFNRVF